MVKIKMNCNNCMYLEWAEGDVNDPAGFICTRKHFEEKKENQMSDEVGKVIY